MGTPKATGTQEAITQQQLSLQQQQQDLANKEYSTAMTLEQPLIDQSQKLISGDPGAQASAAAPYISQITAQKNAGLEAINNTVGPGAARDYAKTQAQLGEGSQIASTVNQLTNSAYGTLSGLGIGQQNFSLQNTGAALSGLQGASQSNQAVMQAQEQAKASTMGFIGQLVGAGAGIATGGLLGGKSGGGGGGGGSMFSQLQSLPQTSSLSNPNLISGYGQSFGGSTGTTVNYGWN